MINMGKTPSVYSMIDGVAKWLIDNFGVDTSRIE